MCVCVCVCACACVRVCVCARARAPVYVACARARVRAYLYISAYVCDMHVCEWSAFVSACARFFVCLCMRLYADSKYLQELVVLARGANPATLTGPLPALPWFAGFAADGARGRSHRPVLPLQRLHVEHQPAQYRKTTTRPTSHVIFILFGCVLCTIQKTTTRPTSHVIFILFGCVLCTMCEITSLWIEKLLHVIV